MHVLAISGSLQERSANSALLRDAARLGAPALTVESYERLAHIPAFNPDTEPAPEPVEHLRARLRASDAVLIATPEYAFGVPGALKNALDWMVGSGDLYGKPVVVVSAAPSAERGLHARADLERTLGAQGARVLYSATIATRTQDAAGIERAVRAALDALTNL